MSNERPKRLRKVSITTVAVVVLTTALSTAVIATHSFNDVPEDNTFHDDIGWLKDNDVTRGCNPPENTEFCPEHNVTREEMSAFMRRLARTSGATADQVTEGGSETNVAIDSDTLTEVASIEVDPKAEAQVVLNAHVVLTIADDESSRGAYEIKGESCTSDSIVAAGHWSLSEDGNLDDVVGNTFALTGMDIAEDTTTYVLCVANEDADSPEASAVQRALTASWTPTD